MNKNIKPILDRLKKTIKTSKYCHPWFYSEHLLVVEKYALELCRLYPMANRDAVHLAVWFHDIGRADEHFEDHDRYAAEYAQKLLRKNEFNPELIDAVFHACRAHRCKDVMPESLEAKILAAADALSHFNGGFYLRIYNTWSKTMDYPEIREKLLGKIDRDYHQKLFFPEAKSAARPFYLAWKNAVKALELK